MQEQPALGVLVAGAHGAIGSTLIAGMDLMARGAAPRIGMVCEAPTPGGRTLGDRIGAPALESIHISGWDVSDRPLGDALAQHRVLDPVQVQGVRGELLGRRALPAPDAGQVRERIEAIRADIRRCREEQGLSQVVVVLCLPTEAEAVDLHQMDTMERLYAGMERGAYGPSIEYATAAVLEGAGVVNFTPNAVFAPALVSESEATGAPLAGRDGKTGQTLMKTAIAPMLALRDLRIEGWYSVNILGNGDGVTLRQPGANRSKVRSKLGCLESIVGYEIPDHQVHIHYYPPRRDNKEAWDNIDIQGFLGYPMQIKINFLARDSILAAPLVLDLARLLSVAAREGRRGVQTQLAAYFKSPESAGDDEVAHDLFLQRANLMSWLEGVAAAWEGA